MKMVPKNVEAMTSAEAWRDGYRVGREELVEALRRDKDAASASEGIEAKRAMDERLTGFERSLKLLADSDADKAGMLADHSRRLTKLEGGKVAEDDVDMGAADRCAICGKSGAEQIAPFVAYTHQSRAEDYSTMACESGWMAGCSAGTDPDPRVEERQIVRAARAWYLKNAPEYQSARRCSNCTRADCQGSTVHPEQVCLCWEGEKQGGSVTA